MTAKVPAANRERTVDIFEFYSALQKYKLLGAKVTDERVMGLKAVCKADAAKIFKKVTKNEQGNQESRMSMVKFHEAVQLVAKVLQVPLDGQPDGKAIRARTITARGPREIQNANTSTLTDDDKFKSHVLLKQEMQAEIDSVQLASHMALASIARNSF